MAGVYLLSCTKRPKCPSDSSKLFVKHVALEKDHDSKPFNSDPEPKEVKNSLIINQLFAEGGKQNVWNNLLMIQFSSYSEDEINKILSGAIEMDGSQYFFLGFSASQLKNKICFLIKETVEEISERRAKFGNLTNTIPFAVRVATVQHMFEPFEISFELPKGEFKFEHDPSNTVSSGFMSPELAKTIKTKGSLAKEPSVVQVICPWFSGNLVLSNEILARANENILDSSKTGALFKTPDAADNCGESLTMGIIDCAKPYNVGYLDIYSVMFLTEMGVARNYFLELQEDYYKILEKLGDADLTFVKYFLRQSGRQELLHTIENEITDDAKRKISKLKEDEIKSMGNDTNPELRVLVSMSRDVFGIEDPYKEDQDKALKSDECVFIPCLDGMSVQEKRRFGSAQKVLVIPRPCYSSTDIRVLTLVRDKEEYGYLKDCIVLPSLPEKSQVVANKFIVCWDEKLLAQKSDSYSILSLPGLCSQNLKALSSCLCSRENSATRQGVEEIKTSQIDRKIKLHEDGTFQDELKKYFASYKSSDDLVSRAKAHFEGFAVLHSPSCSQCKKLGEYLSPSFDWNAKSVEVENFRAELDKKSEGPSSDSEETEDSATQSSTQEKVWREMTKVLKEFIARNTTKK